MCGWVRPPTPSMPFGTSMPCQCTLVCSGSLLVTKMRTLSPDAFDGRAGRLAIVAPQMRGHAGCEFALHRLGYQMEFLPVAVSTPGQRPTVQGDDRLVVRPARRNERRLHGVRGGDRRFRDRGSLDAPADRTR